MTDYDSVTVSCHAAACLTLINNTVAESAVRSRCQLVQASALSRGDQRNIIHRIYQRLRDRAEFQDFEVVLPESLVERLMASSLREIRVFLLSALFNAALEGRRHLVENDLIVNSPVKRPIGFR